jgi:hypothetical protein
MSPLLRFADVLVVLAIAPFVLLAELPVVGYVVGGAAYFAQRVAALALERRAKTAADVRKTVGLNLAGVFARAWFVAIVILVVGKANDRDDGLMAAVLVLIAFTVYLMTVLVANALNGSSHRS